MDTAPRPRHEATSGPALARCRSDRLLAHVGVDEAVARTGAAAGELAAHVGDTGRVRLWELRADGIGGPDGPAIGDVVVLGRGTL